MLRQRWLLFAILLAPSLAGAQVSNPWEYYPLGLGDTWEYDLPGVGHTERVTIKKDTAVAGRTYVVQVRERFDTIGQLLDTDTWIIRYDTLSSSIVRPSFLFPGEELGFFEAPCPFGPGTGSVNCNAGGSSSVFHLIDDVSIGDTTIMNVGIKRFQSAEYVLSYVREIGEVDGWFKVGPYRVLSYARVSGVEYGSPQFPVSTESEGPEPSAPALRVWPNPTREHVTVTITLAQSGEVTVEVFDVLGRRMRAWELSALAAGQHMRTLDLNGLPAGHYVLRMGEVPSYPPVRVTVLR